MLFILLGLMLIIALGILSIPFVMHKAIKAYLLCALFLVLASSSLYLLNANYPALQVWLAQGERHYQLLVEVQELGGVEGMITRVKQKLQQNPNDPEGWLILSRLYFANHQQILGQAALAHAKKLKNH